jgi:serine O-acetyltransferase
MNSLKKLKQDLIALHNYKRKNNTGLKNLFLDTIKNIIFLPSVWFIITFRIGQLIEKIPLIKVLYLILVWRPITIITGIEIYPKTNVGEGLVLPHFGQIFINPKSEIGKGCIIFNGVTIGCDFIDKGSPKIGNNVMIGAGSKIIGPVKIKSDSKIGANKVINGKN